MGKDFYKDIVLNGPNAYACHRIQYNPEGIGIDISIIEANNPFAGLCNLELQSIVNRRLTEVLPGLESLTDNWPALMGVIGRNGEPAEFTYHQHSTGEWFNLQVYSPVKEHCVTLFHRIAAPGEEGRTQDEYGKKFRSLFETMAHGVVYQNAGGVITSANHAAEQILGLSLDQLQGRTSIDPRWKSIHEDGSEFSGEEHPISIALKTGKPVFNKVMGIYNPLTGNIRWINVDAFPDFRNGENIPFQAYAIFTDISDRLMKEKALQESEEKYRFLAENILDVIWVLDIETEKFIYVSQSIWKLRGYTPEEVYLQGPGEIMMPGSLSFLSEVLPKRYLKFIESGISEIYIDELEQPCRDGSTVWTEAVTYFRASPETRKTEVIGTSRDISARKKAEQALKDSEEKFRTAFYLSPDLISITRLSDGRYIDVNDAFVEKSGYGRNEILGNTAAGLGIWANPQDRLLLTETLKKQGFLINFATTFRLKNGQVITGLMSAGLIDIKGESHLLAFTRDITDLKQNQDRIAELLERIALATKSAGMGIWDLNVKDNKLTWDDQMYRLFGKTPDTAEDPSDIFLAALYPDDLKQVAQAREVALQNKGAYDTEFRVVLPDGNLRYLKSFGKTMLNEAGDTVGMSGVNYDITLQKLNEIALHKSEEIYRTVVSASSEGIVLQAKDGKILTWNKAAERIFGITEAEAVGQTSTSRNYSTYRQDGTAFPGDEHPSLITLKTGQPQQGILMKVIRKDHDFSWIQVNTMPVFTEDPETPSSVVITFSDITALKHAGEELRISETRVRRKLEAILLPEGDIGQLELADIIDVDSIQTLMNSFYSLTGIGMGIIDMKGQVLISTGWQEICTKYHRIHPETCSYCLESDTELVRDIGPGEYKLYKCRNNMWDMATPIMLAGRHTGNLFLGQFLFADEEPDRAFFKKQAQLYGFDEDAYLNALERVPRWSHQTVELAMDFYILLANMVSGISYSNIRLAQILEENKKAQQALLASAEVVKSIPSGLFVYQFEAPDQLFLLDANPAALQLTGLKKEDILGKEFNEIWPEAILTGLKASYLKVIQTAEPFIASNIVYEDQRLSGAFKITAFKIPGNKLGIAFENITELKNAENQLILARDRAEKNEALLRTIIENAPFEIWARDLEEYGILENQHIIRHFGSILGRKPDYIEVPEETVKLWKSNNSRVLEGEILNEECLYEINGEKVAFQQIIAPLRKGDKIEGVVGFNIDVNDRRKADEEIRKLNEELEKRVEDRTRELLLVNDELEAFAYTVSHDLRAPLRAINGFTNILKEDYSNLLDKQGQEVIAVITENTHRMGVLIDDLLAFSRLSRAEMNLTQVDMAQLAARAFQETAGSEQTKHIQFIVNPLPKVMADYSLIKQVWINLISNAVKFSSKCENPEITISARKENEKVIFEITDNGVGFNMKYAGKLFGVFQRLHSLRDFEGTGAGLAIVQRIILRHGGTVWAHSVPDQGASFFFSLPEH